MLTIADIRKNVAVKSKLKNPVLTLAESAFYLGLIDEDDVINGVRRLRRLFKDKRIKGIQPQERILGFALSQLNQFIENEQPQNKAA